MEQESHQPLTRGPPQIRHSLSNGTGPSVVSEDATGVGEMGGSTLGGTADVDGAGEGVDAADVGGSGVAVREVAVGPSDSAFAPAPWLEEGASLGAFSERAARGTSFTSAAMDPADPAFAVGVPGRTPGSKFGRAGLAIQARGGRALGPWDSVLEVVGGVPTDGRGRE
jgi:hypothetical protein